MGQQTVSVAGGTADIETVQLLITQRYLCINTCVITNMYRCRNFPNSAAIFYYFVMNKNELLHADRSLFLHPIR